MKIKEKLRYERKYLVPNHLLDALRKRLAPFTVYDSFGITNKNNLKQYTVRSVYFDNRALDFYYEKGDGILLRRKFRIRTYNNQTEDSKVVFEIKRKIENRIKKYRAFASYNKLSQILENPDIERYIIPTKEDSYDDAKRFFYHYIKYQLVPTSLVVYEREAYFGKFDCDTRITFDKDIRSKINPEIADIYSESNLKHLFKSHFILEIKYYRDTMPNWARNIVGEFNLRHEALSKYTIGYDVNKHRVLHFY